MTCRPFLLAMAFAATICAQSGMHPLESVVIEGSNANRNVVLEIAELQIGAPIDKAAIEAAAGKLQACGVFASIRYRYAPSPKGGVILTLNLEDQPELTAATIDVPGADERETWEWLTSRFPNFDRKVPGAEAAQDYLSKAIGRHLGEKLKGQRLVPRMENDLSSRLLSISFQPEVLPRIAEITFTGQQEISADKLTALLPESAIRQGYTDRGFRQLVEVNLRPAYEERGMYRVKFPSIAIRFVVGDAVAVKTAIEEGPKYTLGTVIPLGDAPAEDEFRKAARFKNGGLANWREIQRAIDESEKPLKRQGYMTARATPERGFDDERHVLNLKLNYVKGPLFHFGNVQFQGLTPELEAKARSAWKLNSGDPYNMDYPGEFIGAFLRSANLRQFTHNGLKLRPGTGNNVVDVIVIFQ